MSQTQLATAPAPAKGVVGLINSPETYQKIEEILPHGLTVEEVKRTALMAIHKNPALADCTPASVLLGIMTAARFGVVCDGRNAHLIPYKRNFKDDNKQWQTVMEAQFQWDYKGLVQKVLDSPKVRSIHADIICENDEFRVMRGSEPRLLHEVNIQRPRGEFIAAYAVLTFRDGGTIFDVMTKDEVEAIRMRSKTFNSETGKSSGPWGTDYAEMAKKTAIKRLTKLAPMPADIADAIHADEGDLNDLPRAHATVIPQASIPPKKGAPALPASTTATPEPEPEQSPAGDAGQPSKEEPQQTAPAPNAAAKTAETPAAPKKGPRTMLPTRSKKPEPEPATESAPDPELEPNADDGPELAKLRAKLKEDGISARDFVRVLIDHKWCDIEKLDPSAPVLADAGNEDDFASFLDGDNWLAVQAEIKNLPTEDAAA